MTTTFEHKPDPGGSPSAAPAPAPAPAPAKSEGAQALITEQQVLFSTAAAVALPPAKTRRFSGVVHAVTGAIRDWLASAAKPPAQRHYPKRHVWLENSLMSREMDRL